MIKNKYLILILLSIVFLLFRLPILFTSIDKIYDGQELYMGTIAKEVIEGRTLPLFDYQWDRSKGGTLVAGILAIPFFLVFGQSYFSLKLLALFFSLVILVLSYLFLWKFFDRKVALIGSILFILSPPLFTKFSLMSYGRHYESNLFMIAVIFIFFQIFFRAELPSNSINLSPKQKDLNRDKKIYFAVFGLVSGFAMFFDYIFLVTLVVCFLFWFIFDKRFILRKSFLVFLIFFVVGFSPWIYYNITHNFEGICLDENVPDRPMQELFLSNSPIESVKKLTVLLIYELPNSFSFENFGNIPGHIFSYLYYLVFILSICVLLWLNRKIILKLMLGIVPWKGLRILPGHIHREAFILTYPIVFFLLYSFGCYTVRMGDDEFFAFYGYRKLIVLYPFIFIIISLFLIKLWNWIRRGSKIAPIVFLFMIVFLITSGLAANYNLISLRNFGNHLIYEGYCYDALGSLIGKRFGNDISTTIAFANKVDQPYRAFVFRGIGWDFGWRFYQEMEEYIVRISEIDLKNRPYAVEGLGVFLGWKFKNDIKHTAYFINQIDKEYRPHVYRGLGGIIGWRFGHRIDRSLRKINQVDQEYQSYCYQGLGEAIGSRFGQNITKCIGFLDKIEPEYQCFAFEGLGRHLGWRYKYYIKKHTLSLVEKIPERLRTCFIKGLQRKE